MKMFTKSSGFSLFMVFIMVIGNCDAVRIHERRCKEYQIKANDFCQQHKENPLVSGELSRISNKEEFPHTAMLGFYNHDDNNETNWLCGGSLISERFVLTSAFCIENDNLGDLNYVRLGLLSYHQTEDYNSNDYRIIAVHRHPEYKTSSYYYDIALVKLDRDVMFSKDRMPACLPAMHDNLINKFIKTLWFTNDGNNYYLEKAIVDKITFEKCNQTYSNKYLKLKYGIQMDNQICAEVTRLTENVKSAEGINSFDGPLQIYHKTENCMFTIIGIGCFGLWSNSEPFVYTNVFSFVDWIENIVWNN